MPDLAMPDSDLHELVAAYALDALDEDDRETFERHLASCERCSQELASLRETAASLAYVHDAPAPPPALRSRILEATLAERSNVIPMRRRFGGPALAAATAIAAVVALGVGLWSVSLSRSLDDERAARRATQQALAAIADPTAARHELAGADGSLYVARSGSAALVLCNLDAAPTGKTYEAWVIADGDPVRAGEFEGGEACSAVPLAHEVPADASVAVTVERDGGVDKPSSPPFIRSMPA